MVKQRLLKDLQKVVGNLGYKPTDIVLSIPSNPSFGDYSTNIALQLAKQKPGGAKQPASSSAKRGEPASPAFGEASPRLSSTQARGEPTSPRGEPAMEIAKEIVDKLKSFDFAQDNFDEIKIAGLGFINFFIKPEVLAKQLEEILQKGESFGQNQIGKGKKYQVEFISANPTGPLTLANGRGGALGDTLANILASQGYQVHREYYINDTGNQIRTLGDSVLASLGKVIAKEEHYQGEYIKELAEKFKEKENLPPQELGHLLADYLLEQEIKPAIEQMGIEFDEYYSERSVYERDLITQAVNLLKEKDLAYEQGGALWFRSTRFGDEKDRVLMTSEAGRGRAEPTYFLADIAHHLDVLERGYTKRINILGADHHGYGLRMKGAMDALGFKDKIEIIYIQFVRIFKEGKEVKMSKRAGNFVTLGELLEAVGKDVARFFFLMYAPDSHIDFDLDLAKEKSNKNPVYYVQYAHARMNNIIQKGGEFKAESLDIDYGILKSKEELELVRHISELPSLVEEIAKNYQVQKLPTYAIQLADLFHRYYETSRVLQAETEELKQARLALVLASKIVLSSVLKLMGIAAPERM